jgi:outer membrane protein OmpA-like peptidoglycan-associated protein
MKNPPSISFKMYGRGIFAFCMSLIVLEQSAQNLAPNPSFEEHSYCPVNFNQGQMEIVKGWRQASQGTADYFNGCSRLVGVPDNSFGYQQAKEGEGFLGLITFAPSKRNYREYMQAKLTKPMSGGQLYCVSFYISSADRAEYVADGLGAVFTKDKVRNPTDGYIPMSPHLSNPAGNILGDSDSWILLSDVFEATGGEQYVTMGNFLPDTKIDVKRRNVAEDDVKRKWESAYYFIDDLSIVPVDKRSECTCTIPLIAAEVRDSIRWKLPPGKEVSFDNVLFGFDNDELDQESQETLNEVASWMRNNDFLYLEVMGHTDIIGAEGYNMDLSERRAKEVIAYLTSLGVPLKRLSIDYYGSRKPVADNRMNEGRAQNRRVDFLVIEERYKDYKQD